MMSLKPSFVFAAFSIVNIGALPLIAQIDLMFCLRWNSTSHWARAQLIRHV